eukprot:COSAG04_NODE_480_length_13676_cov_4.040657_4_plen_252_part_00
MDVSTCDHKGHPTPVGCRRTTTCCRRTGRGNWWYTRTGGTCSWDHARKRNPRCQQRNLRSHRWTGLDASNKLGSRSGRRSSQCVRTHMTSQPRLPHTAREHRSPPERTCRSGTRLPKERGLVSHPKAVSIAAPTAPDALGRSVRSIVLAAAIAQPLSSCNGRPVHSPVEPVINSWDHTRHQPSQDDWRCTSSRRRRCSRSRRCRCCSRRWRSRCSRSRRRSSQSNKEAARLRNGLRCTYPSGVPIPSLSMG